MPVRRRAGLLSGVAVAVAVLLPAAGAAAAPAPAGASGTSAGPTVDLDAATPSAPLTGLPDRGTAPDGSTVGGRALAARGTVVADDSPPLPQGLTASAWLVADATTGRVLAARDPHGRYYPASTLKALTLLTLLHRLDPAAVVTGTGEDEAVEGSRVGLVAGGQYPVPLLFEALVLQSGNDAANALARAAGGDRATVALMNRTAAELGAYDTVAGTPSGLDVAGQSSSAYDLALIFRALLEDPAATAVLGTPVADIPPVDGRAPGFQIQNQNPLAGYPGILGGKTGFTDAARHTFVAGAERDGRRLVVSVLDTENVPLRAADQAALLLDWGFAVPAGAEGVGRLVRADELVATATPSRTPTAEPTPTSPPAGTGTAAASSAALLSAPAVGGLGLAGVALSATLVLARRRAARRRAAATARPAPAAPPRGRWPSRRR
ncbi:D-alanyl-D-alanine carboxypeptidase [Blastococcus saxobsidens]|uniref:D-alanyl-D-alanine carboxypeptidase n=1 Tax=Blastococcus saxobsidens TaxID=138336 RepID=A0A6L9W2B7_9ACTN|nr:serine hydrolase [Blastococcus saxobsidens]NEK86143.1 D-alanyl-D-alanine carboxypeptidase [Blastococcus saxobsidens]